jgi:hypothetical protein
VTNDAGLWKPLRLVFFIIVMFNAVTLVVYLRVQEVRLSYRLSRLQADIERENDLRRELGRELLLHAESEALDESGKPLGVELEEGR